MEKMFYTQKQQPIPSLSAVEFISLKNIASKNGFFFKCIKHEKYVLSGAVTLTTTDKRVLPLQVSTTLLTHLIEIPEPLLNPISLEKEKTIAAQVDKT